MSIQDAAAVQAPAERSLEARYAYYRRCQTVRRNGQECKAPAEKGAPICYAHARQQATQERRERERLAVLKEAARQVALRSTLRKEREGWSTQNFGVAEIFTDFNAIQVTIAVMARAVIDGRIDCKTAGRLALELQTASKLLWLQQNAAKKLQQQSRTEQAGSRTSQNVFAGRSRTEQSSTGTSQNVLAGQNCTEQSGSGRSRNIFAELTPSYFLSDSNERLNALSGANGRLKSGHLGDVQDRAGLRPVQIRLRGSPPLEMINSQKAA
jgi:hypothetical protein